MQLPREHHCTWRLQIWHIGKNSAQIIFWSHDNNNRSHDLAAILNLNSKMDLICIKINQSNFMSYMQILGRNKLFMFFTDHWPPLYLCSIWPRLVRAYVRVRECQFLLDSDQQGTKLHTTILGMSLDLWPWHLPETHALCKYLILGLQIELELWFSVYRDNSAMQCFWQNVMWPWWPLTSNIHICP